MHHFFKTWYHQWKELLRERKFRISFLSGIAILCAANFINLQASMFTSGRDALSVGDLILDNIPTVNLSLFYILGMYAVEITFVIYPIFFRPELAPFTAKMIGAFFIIRSFFIILTNLGAPANFYNLPQLEDQWGIGRYFYLNDLFFSGHTGFPYLGALLFWQNKKLRWFLLCMSFAQAATVLLLHIHYSIDVFGAYFITYSIYKVSYKIFNELNLKFKGIVENIKLKMKMQLRLKRDLQSF